MADLQLVWQGTYQEVTDFLNQIAELEGTEAPSGVSIRGKCFHYGFWAHCLQAPNVLTGETVHCTEGMTLIWHDDTNNFTVEGEPTPPEGAQLQ